MINGEIFRDVKNREAFKNDVILLHYYDNQKLLFCVEKENFETLFDIQADKQIISHGIELLSVIHPDDVASFCISENASLKEFEFNFRILKPNSEIIILNGKCTPLLEKNLDNATLFFLKLADVRYLAKKMDEQTAIQTNFEAMMQYSDDFIFFKDAHHVLTASSDALALITGHKKGSELVGKTDYQIFSKELADKYYKLEKDIYEGVIQHANEIHTFVDKEGNEGWMDNRKYPILNSSNQIIGLFGIARIVTEIVNNQLKIEKQNQELQTERNRFSLAIEGAQDGLWDWDLQSDSVVLSERFETMLGYAVGDLPQNIEAWFGLLHPDDKEETTRVVQTYLASKGEQSYEAKFRLKAKDGSWRWILGRGKALFDADGTPLRFVGFNTDISIQVEYEDKLDHTAKHDPLTNLPNRFLLTELLSHAMHSVKRNNQHLALLFIDLDGFKAINDTYGHEAGDKVLSIVAQRMSDIVRKSDIVSRLGGDEFVIVVNALRSPQEVLPMLQRLLSDLSLDIVYEKHCMQVSASIGVSFYPQAEDVGNEVLLRQADQAMYFAKLSGKNQYQIFNLEASNDIKTQQQSLLNLRHAILNDELVLYYQPKVDMSKNRVIGFEALLRWNHPQKGIIYPDDFLPFVENDSKFMVELGHWVLEKAFCQLEAWHMKDSSLTMNINVSSHEVKDIGFATYLKELFAKYPSIKPNTIEIELLETSAFENIEQTSTILRACQELGVSIAIDDFGTGYASLHYLDKLPMNTIKIDKSFIMKLLHSSSNLSIVEASIGLAHAFSCHIVAEGVESEEIGKMLLQLGCDVVQGFTIAKAMPAEDALEWAEAWSGYDIWKSTKRINTDNRALLHASIEHRNWINSVESFLLNKSLKLPEFNPSNCRLGKWIMHDASIEQRKHPAYEALDRQHKELHKYAKILIQSSEDEKIAGINKLRQIHEEILQKLEALISFK
ncbi:MAG: EAL domain-containing protein [Sulfurimonas sp.]|jgi:diguanylate cyclase (GGDEF)-like protein/PAS domain S-box-containing protein